MTYKCILCKCWILWLDKLIYLEVLGCYFTHYHIAFNIFKGIRPQDSIWQHFISVMVAGKEYAKCSMCNNQQLAKFITKSGTNLATKQHQSWCFATVYWWEMWKLTINDMDMDIWYVTLRNVCTCSKTTLFIQKFIVLCAKCDKIS